MFRKINNSRKIAIIRTENITYAYEENSVSTLASKIPGF
jgi:hypothetical protein